MTDTITMRIKHFVTRVFGPEVYSDTRERAARVLEEATELFQAEGLGNDMAQRIIDRTFSRPIGYPPQEVAGLALCVVAYADSKAIDMGAEVNKELDRIESLDPASLRIKHLEKFKAKTAFEMPEGFEA